MDTPEMLRIGTLAAALWDYSGVRHTWTIHIQGEPRAKARHREGRRGARYNPSKPAEDELRWCYRAVYRGQPLEGPVALLCVFWRSTLRRFDSDNGLKLVKDAGNGVLWRDDSQVRAELPLLELDRHNPRTLVIFGACAPPATM